MAGRLLASFLRAAAWHRRVKKEKCCAQKLWIIQNSLHVSFFVSHFQLCKSFVHPLRAVITDNDDDLASL